MSLERTVYERITTAPTLTAYIPAARWFERSAVTDRPVVPYAVLAWTGTVPNNGRYIETLDVYVHDDRGSYQRINDILQEVRVILESTIQYIGLTGWRLAQADFTFRSGAMEDQSNNTNMKYCSWMIVGGKP